MTAGYDSARVLGTIRELESLIDLVIGRPDITMLEPSVKTVHDDILACLDAPRSADEINAILVWPKSVELRRLLTHWNALIHRNTEVALAQRYLASVGQQDPFQDSWINKGFPALLGGQVERWKRVGVLTERPTTRIVIIGGGALPQTQIALHRQIHCEVVALERDLVAAELCRAVLAKSGYAHLPVVACDGSDYDYAGADLVVIATLVDHKIDVARRVSQTNPNAIVAPRTPVRLHRMWRAEVSEAEFEADGWQLLDRFEPDASSVSGLTFCHSGLRLTLQ